MNTRTVFLTTKFKLHEPSQRKCDILDDALREYTRGYEALLGYAEKKFEHLQESCVYRDRLSEKQVSSTLYRQKEYLNELKLPGCLREGLCRDIAISLTAYAEQGDGAGFPTCRDWRSGGGWCESLEALSFSANGHKKEQDLYHEVVRRQYWKSQYMPLLYRRSRDFSVTKKLGNGNLYAILPLLSSRDDRCQRMSGEPLVDVWTGEIIETRSAIRLVFPIEISRENKEWHTRLLEAPYRPKTARLMKDNDEYYLCVTVAIDMEIADTKTILGIDRGVNDLLAARVIDYDGNILDEYTFDNREFIKYQKQEWAKRKRLQRNASKKARGHTVSRRNEELAHRAANAVVELAEQYQARVVMENLKGLDKRSPNFYALRATNYTRLGQILDYKLPLAELPEPYYLCAAYTSQECHWCKHIDKDSRYSDGDFGSFQCTNCERKDNADLNASANIGYRYFSMKVKGVCEAAKHCAMHTRQKNKEVRCSFAKEAISDAE